MELVEALKRAGAMRARLMDVAEARGYMAVMSCERVYPEDRVRKEARIGASAALDAYALDCLMAAAGALAALHGGIEAPASASEAHSAGSPVLGAAGAFGGSQFGPPAEFLSNVDPGDECDRSQFDLYARFSEAR